MCIPPDTLSHLDQIETPETKKDLQHAFRPANFLEETRS